MSTTGHGTAILPGLTVCRAKAVPLNQGKRDKSSTKRCTNGHNRLPHSTKRELFIKMRTMYSFLVNYGRYLYNDSVNIKSIRFFFHSFFFFFVMIMIIFCFAFTLSARDTDLTKPSLIWAVNNVIFEKS